MQYHSHVRAIAIALLSASQLIADEQVERTSVEHSAPSSPTTAWAPAILNSLQSFWLPESTAQESAAVPAEIIAVRISRQFLREQIPSSIERESDESDSIL